MDAAEEVSGTDDVPQFTETEPQGEALDDDASSSSSSDRTDDESASERKRKRADIPLVRRKRRRGGIKKALEVFEDPELEARALAKLRADFFAASGAGSLTSKRKTVETLLRACLLYTSDAADE